MKEKELLQQVENALTLWTQAMTYAEDHHCEDGTRIALRDSDCRQVSKALFKMIETITEGQ